jgi:hypothetical protein
VQQRVKINLLQQNKKSEKKINEEYFIKKIKNFSYSLRAVP